MESFLPSEIARLVLGYLEEHKCEKAYDTFLKTSPNLEECLKMKNDGRKFRTRVLGLSLLDILHEYSAVHSLVQERLKRVDPETANSLKNSGSLLDKLTFLLNATSSGQTMLFSITLPPGKSPQTSTVAHVRKRLRTTSASERRKDSPRKISRIQNEKEEKFCSQSSEIDDPGISTQNLEATSLKSLPGHCSLNRNAEESEISKTPKRKSSHFLSRKSRSASPEAEENLDLSILTKAFLDNHELHEKIAENINKVICTPELSSSVNSGGSLSQEMCQVQNFTSETALNSCTSTNFNVELDNVIKKIVHDTESDPVFENFLQEVVGPVQEETSDDCDDRTISEASTPNNSTPESSKKQPTSLKHRLRSSKNKRPISPGISSDEINSGSKIDDQNAAAIESIVSINTDQIQLISERVASKNGHEISSLNLKKSKDETSNFSESATVASSALKNSSVVSTVNDATRNLVFSSASNSGKIDSVLPAVSASNPGGESSGTSAPVPASVVPEATVVSSGAEAPPVSSFSASVAPETTVLSSGASVSVPGETATLSSGSTASIPPEVTFQPSRGLAGTTGLSSGTATPSAATILSSGTSLSASGRTVIFSSGSATLNPPEGASVLSSESSGGPVSAAAEMRVFSSECTTLNPPETTVLSSGRSVSTPGGSAALSSEAAAQIPPVTVVLSSEAPISAPVATITATGASASASGGAVFSRVSTSTIPTLSTIPAGFDQKNLLINNPSGNMLMMQQNVQPQSTIVIADSFPSIYHHQQPLATDNTNTYYLVGNKIGGIGSKLLAVQPTQFQLSQPATVFSENDLLTMPTVIMCDDRQTSSAYMVPPQSIYPPVRTRKRTEPQKILPRHTTCIKNQLLAQENVLVSTKTEETETIKYTISVQAEPKSGTSSTTTEKPKKPSPNLDRPKSVPIITLRSNEKHTETEDPKLTTPEEPTGSLQLSLSTPRTGRSHIRALDFSTPLKEGISKTGKSPAVSKSEAGKSSVRGGRGGGASVRLPKVPIATRSPHAKLSADWGKINGADLILGTKSPEKFVNSARKISPRKPTRGGRGRGRGRRPTPVAAESLKCSKDSSRAKMVTSTKLTENCGGKTAGSSSAVESRTEDDCSGEEISSVGSPLPEGQDEPKRSKKSSWDEDLRALVQPIVIIPKKKPAGKKKPLKRIKRGRWTQKSPDPTEEENPDENSDRLEEEVSQIEKNIKESPLGKPDRKKPQKLADSSESSPVNSDVKTDSDRPKKISVEGLRNMTPRVKRKCNLGTVIRAPGSKTSMPAKTGAKSNSTETKTDPKSTLTVLSPTKMNANKRTLVDSDQKKPVVTVSAPDPLINQETVLSPPKIIATDQALLESSQKPASESADSLPGGFGPGGPIATVFAPDPLVNSLKENDLQKITPEMSKPSCSNAITAKRNLTPMLETPIKYDSNQLPITPRLCTPFSESPFSKMFADKGDSVSLSLIPTPNFPLTPHFPITPNLQIGDSQTSYASRPTDYSNSSSYYVPSDTEQNQKFEQVLIDECIKMQTTCLLERMRTSTPEKNAVLVQKRLNLDPSQKVSISQKTSATQKSNENIQKTSGSQTQDENSHKTSLLGPENLPERKKRGRSKSRENFGSFSGQETAQKISEASQGTSSAPMGPGRKTGPQETKIALKSTSRGPSPEIDHRNLKKNPPQRLTRKTASDEEEESEAEQKSADSWSSNSDSDTSSPASSSSCSSKDSSFSDSRFNEGSNATVIHVLNPGRYALRGHSPRKREKVQEDINRFSDSEEKTGAEVSLKLKQVQKTPSKGTVEAEKTAKEKRPEAKGHKRKPGRSPMKQIRNKSVSRNVVEKRANADTEEESEKVVATKRIPRKIEKSCCRIEDEAKTTKTPRKSARGKSCCRSTIEEAENEERSILKESTKEVVMKRINPKTLEEIREKNVRRIIEEVATNTGRNTDKVAEENTDEELKNSNLSTSSPKEPEDKSFRRSTIEGEEAAKGNLPKTPGREKRDKSSSRIAKQRQFSPAETEENQKSQKGLARPVNSSDEKSSEELTTYKSSYSSSPKENQPIKLRISRKRLRKKSPDLVGNRRHSGSFSRGSYESSSRVSEERDPFKPTPSASNVTASHCILLKELEAKRKRTISHLKDETSTVAVVKRPRGRPRKYPLPPEKSLKSVKPTRLLKKAEILPEPQKPVRKTTIESVASKLRQSKVDTFSSLRKSPQILSKDSKKSEVTLFAHKKPPDTSETFFTRKKTTDALVPLQIFGEDSKKSEETLSARKKPPDTSETFFTRKKSTDALVPLQIFGEDSKKSEETLSARKKSPDTSETFFARKKSEKKSQDTLIPPQILNEDSKSPKEIPRQVIVDDFAQEILISNASTSSSDEDILRFHITSDEEEEESVKEDSECLVQGLKERGIHLIPNKFSEIQLEFSKNQSEIFDSTLDETLQDNSASAVTENTFSGKKGRAEETLQEGFFLEKNGSRMKDNNIKIQSNICLNQTEKIDLEKLPLAQVVVIDTIVRKPATGGDLIELKAATAFHKTPEETIIDNKKLTLLKTAQETTKVKSAEELNIDKSTKEAKAEKPQENVKSAKEATVVITNIKSSRESTGDKCIKKAVTDKNAVKSSKESTGDTFAKEATIVKSVKEASATEITAVKSLRESSDDKSAKGARVKKDTTVKTVEELSAYKSGKEAAVEKPTKKLTVEKIVEKPATNKSLKEEITHKITKEDMTDKTTKEPIIIKSAGKKSTGKSPEETRTKKSLEEPSTEKCLKQVSDKCRQKTLTGEKATSKSPTEKAPKETKIEETKQKILPSNIGEKATSKYARETAEKVTEEEATTKKSEKETKGEKSMQKTLAKTFTGEKTGKSSEEVDKFAPTNNTKKSTEKLPVRKTAENPSSAKVTQNLSAPETEERSKTHAAEKRPGETLSTDNFIGKASTDKSAKNPSSSLVTNSSTEDSSEFSCEDLFTVEIKTEDSPEFFTMKHNDSEICQKKFSDYNLAVLEKNISANLYSSELNAYEEKFLTFTPFIELLTILPVNEKPEPNSGKKPVDGSYSKKLDKKSVESSLALIFSEEPEPDSDNQTPSKNGSSQTVTGENSQNFRGEMKQRTKTEQKPGGDQICSSGKIPSTFSVCKSQNSAEMLQIDNFQMEIDEFRQTKFANFSEMKAESVGEKSKDSTKDNPTKSPTALSLQDPNVPKDEKQMKMGQNDEITQKKINIDSEKTKVVHLQLKSEITKDDFDNLVELSNASKDKTQMSTKQSGEISKLETENSPEKRKKAEKVLKNEQQKIICSKNDTNTTTKSEPRTETKVSNKLENINLDNNPQKMEQTKFPQSENNTKTTTKNSPENAEKKNSNKNASLIENTSVFVVSKDQSSISGTKSQKETRDINKTEENNSEKDQEQKRPQIKTLNTSRIDNSQLSENNSKSKTLIEPEINKIANPKVEPKLKNDPVTKSAKPQLNTGPVSDKNSPTTITLDQYRLKTAKKLAEKKILEAKQEDELMTYAVTGEKSLSFDSQESSSRKRKVTSDNNDNSKPNSDKRMKPNDNQSLLRTFDLDNFLTKLHGPSDSSS